MAHVAESTHWYTRDGLPAYTVKAKDGTDRPTNLRDARKLNLLPSVTSIIRCAAAPGLEYWKTQQVLLAALTLPRVDGETEDGYMARVIEDSQAQAKAARERGTAIHAAVQGAYDGERPHPDYWPHCNAVQCQISSWHSNPVGLWKAERSFACDMGFGGKADLSCDNAVVDFKTKEFDTTADLKIWDEHAMQLAAYRHGLGMPKARCAIAYVSTTVPGLVKVLDIPEEQLAKGWTMFYSLLHFWQAKNTLRTSFERLAA